MGLDTEITRLLASNGRERKPEWVSLSVKWWPGVVRKEGGLVEQQASVVHRKLVEMEEHRCQKTNILGGQKSLLFE